MAGRGSLVSFKNHIFLLELVWLSCSKDGEGRGGWVLRVEGGEAGGGEGVRANKRIFENHVT